MPLSSSSQQVDPRSSFISERRLSRRLPLTVQLVVNSLSPKLRLTEYCQALVVSGHGCQLRSPRPLKRGMRVRLDIPHSDRIATASVVHCEPLDTDHEALAWNCGLALEQPGNFWGLRSPPDDWVSETRRPEAEPQTPPDRAGTPCADLLRENERSLRRIEALMERVERATGGNDGHAGRTGPCARADEPAAADTDAEGSDRPGPGDQGNGEGREAVDPRAAETASPDAHVRGSLGATGEARLQQAGADAFRRVGTQLERELAVLCEQRVPAFQGMLESSLAPFLDRSQAAARDLQGLLDRLADERAAVEACRLSLRQEREQARDWLAEEVRESRRLIHDTLLDAAGQIKGRIDLGVQMAQDRLEQRVREACGEFEGLVARECTEATRQWDRIAARVDAMGSELERAARAMLEACRAETPPEPRRRLSA